MFRSTPVQIPIMSNSREIKSAYKNYLENIIRIRATKEDPMGWQRSAALRAYVWIHERESGFFLSDLFFQFDSRSLSFLSTKLLLDNLHHVIQ